MDEMAKSGRKVRTWVWVAAAATVVAVLAFRIPIGTVLYVGVLVGFPLFMMRMHGGGLGGGMGCGGGHGGSSHGADDSASTEGGSGHQH